jgi:hypothetical protein
MKILKRLIPLAVVLACVVGVQSASAWHAADVAVVATCNTTTGVYDVTATITQSGQWPGAFVKSVTPTSFPGSTSGSKAVVVKIGWPNSSETQTWTKYVTLDGHCAVVCEPVTIIKEVPGPERIVYVDRPVEVIKYVDRPVEVIKEVQVPGPERVVEKVVEKLVVSDNIQTVTKIVEVKAKPKPCRIPASLKGSTVKRGKDGNCYVTTTKVIKIVKVEYVPKPDNPPRPKPKDCEGDCDSVYKGANG